MPCTSQKFISFFNSIIIIISWPYFFCDKNVHIKHKIFQQYSAFILNKKETFSILKVKTNWIINLICSFRIQHKIIPDYFILYKKKNNLNLFLLLHFYIKNVTFSFYFSHMNKNSIKILNNFHQKKRISSSSSSSCPMSIYSFVCILYDCTFMYCSSNTFSDFFDLTLTIVWWPCFINFLFLFILGCSYIFYNINIFTVTDVNVKVIWQCGILMPLFILKCFDYSIVMM